jgi:hypothetical protein
MVGRTATVSVLFPDPSSGPSTVGRPCASVGIVVGVAVTAADEHPAAPDRLARTVIAADAMPARFT